MFLGKEERLALLILGGVLAAVILSHIILSNYDKSQFASEYQNSSKEGDFVFYNGIVLEVSETKTGGHLLISTQGPAVFVSGGAVILDRIKIDSEIKATGTVSVYNGKKEIFVESTGDIEYL